MKKNKLCHTVFFSSMLRFGWVFSAANLLLLYKSLHHIWINRFSETLFRIFSYFLLRNRFTKTGHIPAATLNSNSEDFESGFGWKNRDNSFFGRNFLQIFFRFFLKKLKSIFVQDEWRSFIPNCLTSWEGNWSLSSLICIYNQVINICSNHICKLLQLYNQSC